MAINWYTSAGVPADSVGADGDLNWDTTNRITWGPKGKVTAGSWAGTAYSNIGPTGPAQLSGTGAPNNSLGQNGQGYCDIASGNTYLKANNAWALSGSILGPQGNPGQTLMNALSTNPGSNGAFNGVTLSSTPYVVPYPGSTAPAYFSPMSSSALMAVYAYASAACTLSLYNVTTSSVVYSVNISAGASIGSQNYLATAYPLTGGHLYQWQVTGSASCNFQMIPFYLMPSNSYSPCIGMAGPAGFASNQTFSSSSVSLPVFGSAAGANRWAYGPPRTGGLYTAQATYTPAAGTPSTAALSFSLGFGSSGTTSTGTVSVTFSQVTATGLPQTILTPRLTDTTSLTTGYFFFLTCSGSGSGTLSVNLFPIV